MDLEGNRVSEVNDLKEATIARNKDLVELSQAIHQLDNMLKEHAKGYSLESLYEKVPAVLKGFVELVYDLNDNPAFRIFEPLLYWSKYYNQSSQSFVLWITENDERPFVLSTPRLNGASTLNLELPFNHHGIDALSKMRRIPDTLHNIESMLGITADQKKLFRKFFTKEPFVPYQSYAGEKIRMRYFGHACVLIETKNISILVDPVISYYGYNSSIDHYSNYDLPDKIDYVLITHNHQDHVLLETLIPLRHKIKNLIVPATTSGALQDPNLKLMFKTIGFERTIEIQDMESLHFSDCTVTGIPFIGEHSDLNIQCKMCYHLKFGEFSILFVADSCNVETRLYEHIHERIGDVDIVFLGMECEGAPLSWLYGPLRTQDLSRDRDRSRTLSGSNYARGKALIDVFAPKEVYVYAMGLEPWLEFISSKRYTDQDHPIVESNHLVEYCLSRGMVAERLFGEKELLRDREVIETA